MTPNSTMIRIIQDVEEGAQPPVRITQLLRSPPQIFFSFPLAVSMLPEWNRVLSTLGEQSVNIRFINQSFEENEAYRVSLCVDKVNDERIPEISTMISRLLGKAGPGREARIVPGAIILSFYVFKGQPRFIGGILKVLRDGGIEMLSAGVASSVLSCVIRQFALNAALDALAELSWAN